MHVSYPLLSCLFIVDLCSIGSQTGAKGAKAVSDAIQSAASEASSDLKEATGAKGPAAPAPAPAPAATGNAAANPFRMPGMSDEEKAERAKYAAPVAVIPDDISSKFGGALLRLVLRSF